MKNFARRKMAAIALATFCCIFGCKRTPAGAALSSVAGESAFSGERLYAYPYFYKDPAVPGEYARALCLYTYLAREKDATDPLARFRAATPVTTRAADGNAIFASANSVTQGAIDLVKMRTHLDRVYIRLQDDNLAGLLGGGDRELAENNQAKTNDVVSRRSLDAFIDLMKASEKPSATACPERHPRVQASRDVTSTAAQQNAATTSPASASARVCCYYVSPDDETNYAYWTAFEHCKKGDRNAHETVVSDEQCANAP